MAAKTFASLLRMTALRNTVLGDFEKDAIRPMMSPNVLTIMRVSTNHDDEHGTFGHGLESLHVNTSPMFIHGSNGSFNQGQTTDLDVFEFAGIPFENRFRWWNDNALAFARFAGNLSCRMQRFFNRHFSKMIDATGKLGEPRHHGMRCRDGTAKHRVFDELQKPFASCEVCTFLIEDAIVIPIDDANGKVRPSFVEMSRSQAFVASKRFDVSDACRAFGRFGIADDAHAARSNRCVDHVVPRVEHWRFPFAKGLFESNDDVVANDQGLGGVDKEVGPCEMVPALDAIRDLFFFVSFDHFEACSGENARAVLGGEEIGHDDLNVFHDGLVHADCGDAKDADKVEIENESVEEFCGIDGSFDQKGWEAFHERIDNGTIKDVEFFFSGDVKDSSGHGDVGDFAGRGGSFRDEFWSEKRNQGALCAISGGGSQKDGGGCGEGWGFGCEGHFVWVGHVRVCGWVQGGLQMRLRRFEVFQ